MLFWLSLTAALLAWLWVYGSNLRQVNRGSAIDPALLVSATRSPLPPPSPSSTTSTFITASTTTTTSTTKPAVITRETLTAAHGDAPRLLLSIVGHVFDVSEGRDFYGKGGGYGFFAGTDATRSFATGDFTNDLNDSVEGFTEQQCMAIESWLTFYRESPKYPFVGYLQGSAYIHPDTASIINQLADDYSDRGMSFTRTHTDIQSDVTAQLLGLQNILTPAYADLMACAQRGHEEDARQRNDVMNAPCNTQTDIRSRKQDIWCNRVTVAVAVAVAVDVNAQESEDSSSTDTNAATAANAAATATKVVIRLPRRMVITHKDKSITERCVCIPADKAPTRHDVHVYDGCDATAERCVMKV